MCNNGRVPFVCRLRFIILYTETTIFRHLCGCILVVDKPFSKRQILDSSRPKEFADDNFNSDENGRKFSKRVENTVGKGEIARYEQFLLFPQCFQKNFTGDTEKG